MEVVVAIQSGTLLHALRIFQRRRVPQRNERSHKTGEIVVDIISSQDDHE